MRILGVDPGLTTTGLGIVDASKKGLRAIDWCSIETASSLALSMRLLELSKDFEAFLDETEIDQAVVERLFMATNTKTAMDVAHARGVLLLSLEKRGIPIREITPLQMKLALTGDGKADKKQIQAMVQRTLRLKTLPTPVDAADALGLAIYGAHHVPRA